VCEAEAYEVARNSVCLTVHTTCPYQSSTAQWRTVYKAYRPSSGSAVYPPVAPPSCSIFALLPPVYFVSDLRRIEPLVVLVMLLLPHLPQVLADVADVAAVVLGCVCDYLI